MPEGERGEADREPRTEREGRAALPGRRRLALYTFAAVFLTIVGTGLWVVPALIQSVERQYLELQADVNARQARSLSLFVDARLRQGIPEQEVIAEFQAVIANSDADRGFSCMIDRATASFISHPMEQALGMSVVAKQARFESWEEGAALTSWENAISSGDGGSGILYLPDQSSEVVHMVQIPETGWTISTHENTARLSQELSQVRTVLIAGSVALGFLIAVLASIAARRVGRRYESKIEAQNEIIREEQQKSEALLLNILPEAVADELKSGRETIAERHANVSVLFADLVGFTELSSRMPAEEVVGMLNRVFSAFDDLSAKYDLEKIKTIGDAYMVCGGLRPSQGDAAKRVADMGFAMIEALHQINEAMGLSLEVRIGIHSGEVVAGVIGKQKFIYDLWGDVVNTASRMESSGVVGRIQVTEETQGRLEGDYDFEDLGAREFKGKGRLRTFLLTRADG